MPRSCSRISPLVLGLLVVSSGASAAAEPARPDTAAAAPTPERSPFLGRWELDLTRMPSTYGPSPKRVVYAFSDIGSGMWLTTIDITAQDGSVRHMEVRYARDGQAGKSSGDLSEGDSAAVGSPGGNVLVMSIAADKRLGSVRTYAISADGLEMTEAAANVNGDGVPFVRNFHFRRIS